MNSESAARAKYLKLVERLIQRTRDGNAKWESTADSTVFALAMPQYSVLVYLKENRHGVAIPTLKILNADGLELDEVGPDDLTEGVYEYSTLEARMQALYDDARRIARGVDAALDSLLGELDDIPF